jgi:hypothetical protein
MDRTVMVKTCNDGCGDDDDIDDDIEDDNNRCNV